MEIKNLSNREKKAIRLLTEFGSIKQTAKQMGLTEQGFKNKLHLILGKLQCTSYIQLIVQTSSKLPLDSILKSNIAAMKHYNLLELDLRWMLADAEAGKRVLIVTDKVEYKLVLLKEISQHFHCKFEFTKVPTGIEVRRSK